MCNFHYVAMPMMTSQILKSADFIKTQKSRYIKNETNIHFHSFLFIFFISIHEKNSLIIKGYFMAKNSFVA